MSGDPRSRMLSVFADIRERLDAADLRYTSSVYRDDAVSLLVNKPGEYWEIDVLQDGSVDVEIYASTGLSENPMAAIDSLVQRSTTKPSSERN